MLIIVYYSSLWPAYISELANLNLITISKVDSFVKFIHHRL